MKDMKITKAEAQAKEKKYSEPCMVGGSGDRYPYGLQVRLDSESLKKLGITSLPKVGKRMTLKAVVVVESASENQRREGEPSREVSLQITKMELTSGTGAAASAVDAIEEALED